MEYVELRGFLPKSAWPQGFGERADGPLRTDGPYQLANAQKPNTKYQGIPEGKNLREKTILLGIVVQRGGENGASRSNRFRALGEELHAGRSGRAYSADWFSYRRSLQRRSTQVFRASVSGGEWKSEMVAEVPVTAAPSGEVN